MRKLMLNVVILLVAVLIATLLIWLFPEQCSAVVDWKNINKISIVKWTVIVGVMVFGILLVSNKIRFGTFHHPYSKNDMKDKKN